MHFKVLHIYRELETLNLVSVDLYISVHSFKKIGCWQMEQKCLQTMDVYFLNIHF